VERIEAALAPYEPRPHWSKVFTPGFDVASCYPKLTDFRELARSYDPRGVFRNSFLERTVLG
jgi:alditol oxidase